MLLIAIEVNAFLIENGCIIDVGKFVGLNCIRHNAFANLCLLTVHAKIQPFQNLLEGVRDVLKRILVTTEDAVVITIAYNLVIRKRLALLLVFLCLL